MIRDEITGLYYEAPKVKPTKRKLNWTFIFSWIGILLITYLFWNGLFILIAAASKGLIQ